MCTQIIQKFKKNMYTDRKITGYKADTSSIKQENRSIKIQTTKYRYADFYHGRVLIEFIFQLLSWAKYTALDDVKYLHIFQLLKSYIFFFFFFFLLLSSYKIQKFVTMPIYIYISTYIYTHTHIHTLVHSNTDISTYIRNICQTNNLWIHVCIGQCVQ